MVSYNSAPEVFDDGTPLSYYRQQVARMYGSGGSGGGGGSYRPAMKFNQLYTNSFGYQNMLMGGGFLRADDGFGPAGMQTSRKWRGYGRSLLRSKSGYGGYGGGGDRLTNVHVVPSGAADEYKDSYVTMIADTLKRKSY